MKKTGILIGYFAKRGEAREAFAKLRRKGFRRVAWASKSESGKIQTRDPFRRRRIWTAVAAFILFGVPAQAISMWAAWPATMSVPVPESLLPGLAGGCLGILAGATWMRRS